MPRRARSLKLRHASAAVGVAALLGACGAASPSANQLHQRAIGASAGGPARVSCRGSACTVATSQPFLASAQQARFHALPFVTTVYADPLLTSIDVMTLHVVDATRGLTATFDCEFRGLRPAHPPQVQATTVALVRRLCRLAVRPSSQS
jgi:hypothetical protein